MKHNICNGECDGVSEESGVCRTENCTMRDEPLKECLCPSKENHQPYKKESSQSD